MAEPFYLDSHIRILDFSKPVDPSKTSIDISTDNITTAIRLPDDIPRLEGAVLLISEGVMHMLPGKPAYLEISDEYGNILNTTEYRANLTDRVWDFDLKSQEWSVHVSGISLEDRPKYPAVAYDAEKQVGWFYGGLNSPDVYSTPDGDAGDPTNQTIRVLQDLYRLDQGKSAPTRVTTGTSFVGSAQKAELDYIEGAGEAGILVLLGGDRGTANTYVGNLLVRELDPNHQW